MTDVFSEHRSLVEAGRLDDAMRFSGEQLAASESRLRNAVQGGNYEEIATRASEFLGIAQLHVADLAYAGMAQEQAGTALLVIATVLMSRVNPEGIPDIYLNWLQVAVSALGSAMEQTGDMRLADNFELLIALATDTADDFAKRLSISPELIEANNALKEYRRQAGLEGTLYKGQKIVPQLAIDIIFETLNEMAHIGWLKD